MGKKKAFSLRDLAIAGIIAGLYAVLTYAGGFFGLSYGAVQFRLSEVLTVLPVFTPAAIPGLIFGCIFANAGSPLGLMDLAFGTAATAIAALSGRALRNVRIRELPLLSLLMPVISNALLVGLEFYLLTPDAGWTGFLWGALTVGAGQLIVCCGLGIPFYYFLKKHASYIM